MGLFTSKKKKQEQYVQQQAQVHDSVSQEFNMPVVDYGGDYSFIPRQTTEEKLRELSRMDNLQFEFYLCRIFQLKGCVAKFTPVLGDCGADMLIEHGEESFAVRCRLVAEGTLLTEQDIDEALTSLKYYPVKSVMLITNGYFDKKAIKYAARLPVVLVDRNLLIVDFLNYKIPEPPKEVEETVEE